MKNPKARATSSLHRWAANLFRRAVAAGPPLTLAVSSALAGLLGYGIYQTFVVPEADGVRAARAKLEALRRENLASEEIGRTKPQFLAEFRRALEKYDEARQLLPEEVEVSNVLAAVQGMA
ncbi:MAG TPA: hypothetical protein VM870_06245, partial [Pyrinomonadaceae bacterium]|nr:hypothetical protein [Pyrinomonadaceae bacterium]